jgi:TRAP-type mannitol/chloroaromatic compound transport system permease small subunit
MHKMDGLLHLVDSMNKLAGRTVAWLVPVLMLTISYEVIMRYGPGMSACNSSLLFCFLEEVTYYFMKATLGWMLSIRGYPRGGR